MPARQRPLTPLQAQRVAALARAGVSQADVLDATNVVRRRRGVAEVGRETVRRVLLDAWQNPDVVRAFCRLTHTTAAEMFPARPDAVARGGR